MHIAKQGLSFVAVGCGLIVADWAAFVVLTAAGMDPVLANVLGRVVGALLGFWANGWITFASHGGPRLGAHRFLKYAAVWILMTTLSTVLVTLVVDHLSLHTAWMAKPLVEACLALVSFFISRQWVYR